MDDYAKTEALCEALHVSRDFTLPNGQPLRAVEDVSVSVVPDEIVALLGPSGCGKSTILRILAGLLEPTQGEVLYHGQPLRGLNPGAAVVFQSFALYPWMTVVENVRTVLRAAGLPRDQALAQAENAIRLVGLTGFEPSYPRELSGGMKQRVGMARALAVDPEILFMDEPFSQVDALTAESLRAEVLDIWQAKQRKLSSILMVSHDIKEVAFMADRIIILGANPGTVRVVVQNDLPRPRAYRSARLAELVDHLHDLITGSELPDVPPASEGEEELVIESLPEAPPSEIVGLLEYLDARDGKRDVFRITVDTQREFGRIIGVVRAAEMLEFVDTPRRQVVLEPLGRQFLDAPPERRTAIWRDQLLKLRLFREIVNILDHQLTHEVSREVIVEFIVMAMPQENYEQVFDVMITWARYGELLSYDESTETVSRL